MKTPLSILFLVFALLTIASYSGKYKKNTDVYSVLKDSSSEYMDGTYEGYSRSIYTSEPFWGHIQIKVSNSKFTEISFVIRDSSTHEFVDSMYGVIHYAGNPTYQKQCVNDGYGIEIYPQKLIESQDIDNIDAISGATWSCNIFRASAKAALKDAKKTSSIDFNNERSNLTFETYPNPFNTSVEIKYSLKASSNVKINIFNLEGKLIAELENSLKIPGEYSVQWNNCPSTGTYIYYIKAYDRVISGKLISIK